MQIAENVKIIARYDDGRPTSDTLYIQLDSTDFEEEIICVYSKMSEKISYESTNYSLVLWEMLAYMSERVTKRLTFLHNV